MKSWSIREWIAILSILFSVVYSYASQKITLSYITVQQHKQGVKIGQVVRYLSSKDPHFYETVNSQGGDETP